jgi:hypothetical protein
MYELLLFRYGWQRKYVIIIILENPGIEVEIL